MQRKPSNVRKGGNSDVEGRVDTASSPLSLTTTTRKELWAYYIYYIGNNGLSGFNFGPSQFQNLLFLAGYDPHKAPFSAPCNNDSCVLPFLGRVRDVSAIVLLTNGMSFAMQAILLIAIGTWADYGTWRPKITVVFTLLAVGVAFAWLGADAPDRWHIGVPLYILGLIAYQCSLTFWTAAFPGLARDLPEIQRSLSEVKSGKKTEQEHAVVESLARNRISNISFTVSSFGEIVILGCIVGILKLLGLDTSMENNTKALSIVIAFSGGVWLLCAIPWFVLEKKRPGLEIPPGNNIFFYGPLQLHATLQECFKLKQTFLYLVFYFLMGDVLNTTVTVVATLQNSVVSYSTLQLTYLLMVGIAAQFLGIYAFWIVQYRFKLSTKVMLSFNAFWIIVLALWGLVGVWTDRFGFKHVWEIWLYQAFYGLLVCPWYAYSQTMISEVSPGPKMFLFFATFSVVGKTSAFIGPFVSSAIISASDNNRNMPFAFLFGLGVFSASFLWMLNVDKSRLECDNFDAEIKSSEI